MAAVVHLRDSAQRRAVRDHLRRGGRRIVDNDLGDVVECRVIANGPEVRILVDLAVGLERRKQADLEITQRLAESMMRSLANAQSLVGAVAFHLRVSEEIALLIRQDRRHPLLQISVGSRLGLRVRAALGFIIGTVRRLELVHTNAQGFMTLGDGVTFRMPFFKWSSTESSFSSIVDMFESY